jgi:hypothetical protein
MQSPTRSALAIIVGVGFTAPIDGKKLASVTYKLSIPCALQLRSRTDCLGSVPNRSVPAWWAVPPIGGCVLIGIATIKPSPIRGSVAIALLCGNRIVLSDLGFVVQNGVQQ